MTTVSAVMAMVGLRPFNRPLVALVGIEVDQHIGITSFAHQLLQVESTYLAAREGKLTIMVGQLEEVGLRHRGLIMYENCGIRQIARHSSPVDRQPET